MSKRFAQAVWLVIINLFIAMEVYHVVTGRFDELATSLLAVVALLSMFGVYFLIKQKIE